MLAPLWLASDRGCAAAMFVNTGDIDSATSPTSPTNVGRRVLAFGSDRACSGNIVCFSRIMDYIKTEAANENEV